MLIINGKIITWGNPNQILEEYAIRVSDGIITEIDLQDKLLLDFQGEDTLDAGGQYIMPGNICSHTHFYGAYARGLAIPGAAPKDFPEILGKLWWPLDKSLTYEDVKNSALVCLVDAIKHGTTTLLDHHASPNAIDGSLDVIADAVEQSGLRTALCYEVTDRDGRDRAEAGIKENLRFMKRIASGQNGGGKLAAMFGLHASMTLSDETLEQSRREILAGFGFHIHTAESLADEDDSVSKSGTRVIDRMNRFGILGPKSIAVHSVQVDAQEIRLLADTGTWVTHQPRSNMNNAVGIAPIESMLRAGVRVGIGNDGFSNAMWEEWKTVYLAHKLWNRDPRRMSGDKVIQMAVYNNSDLVNTIFSGPPIGVIQPGAAADLIFVEYYPYTPLTAGNLPWQILFGFRDSMVTTTIVAGKVLMKDRKILTLDEKEISAEALRSAPAVWERYQNKFL